MVAKACGGRGRGVPGRRRLRGERSQINYAAIEEKVQTPKRQFKIATIHRVGPFLRAVLRDNASITRCSSFPHRHGTGAGSCTCITPRPVVTGYGISVQRPRCARRPLVADLEV